MSSLSLLALLCWPPQVHEPVSQRSTDQTAEVKPEVLTGQWSPVPRGMQHERAASRLRFTAPGPWPGSASSENTRPTTRASGMLPASWTALGMWVKRAAFPHYVKVLINICLCLLTGWYILLMFVVAAQMHPPSGCVCSVDAAMKPPTEKFAIRFIACH